jgi:hypothetical protein
VLSLGQGAPIFGYCLLGIKLTVKVSNDPIVWLSVVVQPLGQQAHSTSSVADVVLNLGR